MLPAMARWEPREPQEPQAAPLVASLEFAVKTDMQEYLGSEGRSKIACSSEQAGSPAGDVRAAAQQNRFAAGIRDDALVLPRVALFPRDWLRFRDFTRDLAHLNINHHNAAAKLSILSPRAQCPEGPVGIAGNASDTRLFPSVWILSIMSSASRGSSMLHSRRFVLQGMRYDEFAGSTQRDQAS